MSRSKPAISSAIPATSLHASDDLRLYPVPLPGIARDACACFGLQQAKSYRTARDPLCVACMAWEEGYVLVAGERRYRRAVWLMVNYLDMGDAVR